MIGPPLARRRWLPSINSFSAFVAPRDGEQARDAGEEKINEHSVRKKTAAEAP